MVRERTDNLNSGGLLLKLHKTQSISSTTADMGGIRKIEIDRLDEEIPESPLKIRLVLSLRMN